MEEIEEVIHQEPIKKKRGWPRERMLELHKIQSEMLRKKREDAAELKRKEQEIIQIEKDRIEFEYKKAQKIKKKLESKMKELEEEDDEPIPISHASHVSPENLYKSASRDILREQYINEALKRVKFDLFY